MFPVLGLFHTLACPEQKCSKVYCPFSHKNPKDLPPPVSLDIPAAEPLKPPPKPLVPVAVKRQIAQTSAPGPSTPNSTVREPPRKLQKTGTAQRPVAVSTTSQTEVHLEIERCNAHSHWYILIQNGVPILRVNPARSSVAIPVRQVRFIINCTIFTF